MTDTTRASIFALGQTGFGKSSLCKLLANGSSKFIVSNSTSSQTMRVAYDEVPVAELGVFRIYDTPGLDDSNNRDAEHIREMYTQLSKVSNCAAFLLVSNPKNPRLSGSERATIAYFRDMFGPGIVENLAVVYSGVTKYDYEQRLDMESLAKKAKEIGSLFGTIQNEVPLFFFESSLNEKLRDFDEELKFQQQQIAHIFTWASCRKLYDCTGAKLVSTKEDLLLEEMAKLKIEKENEAKEAAKAKKEAEDAKREAESAKASSTLSYPIPFSSYYPTSSPFSSILPVNDIYGGTSYGNPYLFGSSFDLGDYYDDYSPSTNASGGTVYSGRGRPRNSDYTRGGNIRYK